jgi:hypothetical protein
MVGDISKHADTFETVANMQGVGTKMGSFGASLDRRE